MNIDQFIADIRAGKHPDEAQVSQVLLKLQEVLIQEPTCLKLELPITVCGDIHGQLYDLFELFKISGSVEKNHYLFLGDYVDRGYYSVETFCYLAALKLRYPDRVHLLRGNHECRQVNTEYGFYGECVSQFGHSGVWELCNSTFDLLPLAAVVGGKIFCCHGGLSPSIKYVEQVATLERNVDLPYVGPMTDLTWSDPDNTCVNGWMPNQRGAGYIFGQNETNQFCQNNKLDLICRAHQIAMKGYEYFFGEEKIVTVWSAPNYLYRSGNDASVLKIDQQYHREFVIFKEVPNDQRVIPEDAVSSYFV